MKIKVYRYPSVPDNHHKWCSKCKRAMLDMEYGDRICPMCGNKVNRIK